MTFKSTSSIMPGDRANGNGKNGRGEQFSKMPIELVLSVDGLVQQCKACVCCYFKVGLALYLFCWTQKDS